MEFAINELAILVGMVTPFITAVTTKVNEKDWFKGLVSMTLALAGGAAIAATESGGVELASTLENGVTVWAFHLMSYFGISKDAVADVAAKTRSFGLGR